MTTYIPQSFSAIKKEYLETPFWISRFMPGSQMTIVEDVPKNKPLRFAMRPSNKGGPAYPVNLIRINDGYITKDLELSKTATQLLFVNIPDTVENLKGVTLANDNGRWVFVSQASGDMNENFPQPSYKPTEAPTQAGSDIKQLHGAIELNGKLGIETDIKKLMIMAEAIRPGDALGLIDAAKKEGWICEIAGRYRGT